jgi:hypothetical protein
MPGRTRHLGTRADETHRAAQHVDQLRELVELEVAQPGTDAGDAAVAGHGERRSVAGLERSHHHGAELEDAKDPAVPADAFLAEEHRARRLELDRDREQPEQRRKQQQPGAGGDDVERPLHRTAITTSRAST